MPRNGSGEYTLPYNWNDDKANGIKVLASRMQNQDQDIANALTGSLASDGQTPLTGDLDFNGNQANDLADGTATQDAVTVGQVQTGELQYYGVSSTIPLGTDGRDYEVNANPTLTEYVDGLSFSFVAHFTSIANPVLRVDTEAELDMIKDDGNGGTTALITGDLVADGIYEATYNTVLGVDKLLILNPEKKLSDVKTLILQPNSTLTIATGVVTANGTSLKIATQGAAAQDDLDTINGLTDGQIVVIRSETSGQVVTLKHNTGNIWNPCEYDINLALNTDIVEAKYDGGLSKLIILSFSTTGSNADQLLQTKIASSSGSLEFISQINSQFKNYDFDLTNILPANNGVMLTVQVTTDGGSTWLNSNYVTTNFWMSSADALNSAVAGKTSGLSLTGSDANNQTCPSNIAADGGINGTFSLINPSNASVYKQAKWDLCYSGFSTNNYQFLCKGTGRYKGSTAAINGIRFIFKTVGTDTNNGAIASGQITMRGKK